MITHHIHAPLRWTLLLCFAAALSIGQARAETWYLKIDGIPGVREEPGLPGWTVVLDLKASAAVPINPTNRVPGAPGLLPPPRAASSGRRLDRAGRRPRRSR